MKKYVITILIIIIICLLSSCAEQISSSTTDDNEYISYVQSKVIIGEISSYYTVKGTVVAAEDSIKSYTFPISDYDNLKNLFGKELNEGDSIYAEQTCDFFGKIIDVKTEDNYTVVNIVDYSKLVILTQVDYEHYQKLDYSTPVTVTYGSIQGNANIIHIDYHFSNDYTTVKLASEAALMPGLEVDISFITETRENSMYIPFEALYKQGDEYYVKKLINGEPTDTNVYIGELFSVEENGYTFKYAEIVSGLEKGDTVVFGILKDSTASRIYEEFIK